MQLGLGLKFWGGKRKGAGRKPVGSRPGVSHRRKLKLTKNAPAHVTLKLLPGVARLRLLPVFEQVERAIVRCAEKAGFRIVEYSVQDDHIHMLVEASSAPELARGMQGVCTSIAKRLNKFL